VNFTPQPASVLRNSRLFRPPFFAFDGEKPRSASSSHDIAFGLAAVSSIQAITLKSWAGQFEGVTPSAFVQTR
jgi:hypothetical protein